MGKKVWYEKVISKFGTMSKKIVARRIGDHLVIATDNVFVHALVFDDNNLETGDIYLLRRVLTLIKSLLDSPKKHIYTFSSADARHKKLYEIVFMDISANLAADGRGILLSEFMALKEVFKQKSGDVFVFKVYKEVEKGPVGLLYVSNATLIVQGLYSILPQSSKKLPKRVENDLEYHKHTIAKLLEEVKE